MSATNMKLFLLLGFSLLLHHEIEGITTHSVTQCSNNINISCNNTDMIHVERITFYNGTDCNQNVTDLQVCGLPLTGSDVGLVTSCNGKVSCSESLYYGYCPGSKAAKVDYRCIPGSNVKHMCQQFILKNTNRIFLSTPNYPLSPTFTDISPCRCFISGSSITSIQILELVLTSASDGTKSSLYIDYGDGTYKAESFSDTTRSRRVYNEILSTTSTTAEITLNRASSNRQYLLIEVQGVAMHVAYNIGRTLAPSPSTTPESSSPAADVKSQSQGITTHSVTGCSDRVLLNCSNTEMIHVERITFYNGTDCNQAVTDLQVCGQPLTGSDTGLVPYCNGRTTCNETINYNTCPGNKADYRCIPGNDVIDMCDLFIIKHTDRIFLSTPNYPLTPTFTDIISPCRCFIRGSSITSIQILELVLTSASDGTTSSLEVKYGDVTYKTESFSETSSIRRVYNKRLLTTSTTAELILNKAGSNRQYLWIEVQGVSMYVACTIVMSTPSTTISPSSSPSTPEKQEDKDPTIDIILIVLLFLCLPILCIKAIIDIVFIRKRNRLKKKHIRT